MPISGVMPEDTERLKFIARQAMEQSVEMKADAKQKLLQSIERGIDSCVSDPESIYLKYAEDDIIGFILMINNGQKLSLLFVLPNTHSRGVGKALWSQALKLCQQRNQQGSIRVNSSLNAVGFYKKLGFEDFTPDEPISAFAKPLIYRY